MSNEELLTRPLFSLTVGEFLDLQKQVQKIPETPAKEKYVYGITGLASLLHTTTRTAQRIKSSGKLDQAIKQQGRIIAIDKEKALELYYQ